MDYMIYIYAALAFILTGGGAFIGFHAGYRIGKRETKNKYFTIKAGDYGRRYEFVPLPRGAGRVAHKEKQVERLRSLIAEHQKRMDQD